MRFLRTNTAIRLTVGPFLDKGDGVTPETSLTVTSCKLTLMVDDANVPTLILDTAPTASGGANDMVHVTGDDAGFYDLELAAANVNYLGRAMLAITDAATHCPVFHEFMILPAMIYDSLVLGTDRLDTNTSHWNDLATVELPLVPTTAGRKLDVSAGGEAGVDWANVGSPTTSLALTGTTIATTQKVDVETIKTQTVTCAAGVTVSPFVGNATAAIVVDASGNANCDVKEINNSTTTVTNLAIVFNTDFATNYSTANNKWQVEANVLQISGDTTAADNAESFFDGTGYAGTNNVIPLVTVTTTVTNQLTAAQIATGVWQDSTAGDFSQASSIGKALYISNIAPGAAGGHFIAGSNAGTTTVGALTVTGAFTAGTNALPWNAAYDAEVESEVTDALNAYDPPTKAELDAGLAAADDAVLAAIAALTIPTTGQITTAVWTTALTEAYRATGATGTGAQLMYEILGNLINFANAGTTRTVTKLDKTTTAKTYTYDDATTPTASEETT